MKRILVLCCALLIAGCSGVKGRITLKSQCLDGKVTAIVSQEGEDNARNAVYHVYLVPTAGGTPDEVVWTEHASQVYVRWDSDDHILVVFNGGAVHYTRTNDARIAVPVDGGARQIGIWLSTDTRAPAP
jgi:dipeptidyl aminopeptidase/acylaminoacyl peptidase